MRARSLCLVITTGLLVSGPAAAHEGHDPATNVRLPLATTPQTAAAAKLYDGKCAVCHGKALEGTKKGPSLIPYDPAHHPDGTFRDAITLGVKEHHWKMGNMPPIEGLTDAEIESLIDYIRDVQAFNSTPANGQ